MELRHLRYFRAVAEELHFGRAADRLHIAQPPLSQQIQQLERELGVALFIRSTRRVELTDAGRAYLARVLAILDAVDAAGRQARRIDAGLEGQITIGCVGSATYSLLPELVRSLRSSLPHVDVGVRGEMLAPAQADALVTGDIDVALLRPPVRRAEVETVTLRRDHLLVALPAEHRLGGVQRVRIRELHDEDFIAHAGQGRSVMSDLLIAACADAGFVPRIRHEVTETSTLVTMVAAGLGVALVPAPTAALAVAGVRYLPVTPASLGVDLLAAWSAGRHSPTVARTVAVLQRLSAAAH